MPSPSSEPVASFVARCLLAWLVSVSPQSVILCSYLGRSNHKSWGTATPLSVRPLFPSLSLSPNQLANNYSLLRPRSFTIPKVSGVLNSPSPDCYIPRTPSLILGLRSTSRPRSVLYLLA
ncbi:hypothetical protein F5B21DRAFT_31534 [Xylaria acuta]|nr:hypothetical protein F5B21DRAFT_31534 [Xylaria acuta]